MVMKRRKLGGSEGVEEEEEKFGSEGNTEEDKEMRSERKEIRRDRSKLEGREGN